VVCKTKEEALTELKKKNPEVTSSDIKQDEDVLDTWFSSWLWPISVFDGFKNPKGKDIQYYYPTNDLVTAPEILFFWVARMIIAGYEYRGNKPFTNVYLTGIVRDKLGRKMSKQLGNSPDPIELMEKYGADGVRVGMLLCSPAGNDLPFDESLCEQGRNFSNKIWNAFRLIKGWEVDENMKSSAANEIAVKWFEAKFDEQLQLINDLYSKYRMSEALMTSYKLAWDEFCSWYLEMIKPEFVDGKSLPIDRRTYEATISFFEKVLKVLHPFVPFITEEIWHLLAERKEKDCILVSSWPGVQNSDLNVVNDMDAVIELITNIRNIRKQKNISPKEKLQLFEKSNSGQALQAYHSLVIKLCNLSGYEHVTAKVDKAYSFVLKQGEFYVPLTQNIDRDAEKARLSKELEYNQGFLKSVQIKLSNEKFVANAKPDLIANERKKQADAEAKIKAIEEQLANLN
jgi:valyl-tRNA synthetase